jgi:hypothetical protein
VKLTVPESQSKETILKYKPKKHILKILSQKIKIKWPGKVDNYKSKAIPSSPTLIFPKSPACRVSSSGAPCSFPLGLKCGPAIKHVQKMKFCTFIIKI